MNIGIPSVSVQRLEKRAGKRRRRHKAQLGEPRPLHKKRSGGGKKSKRKGSKYQLDIAKKFKRYYGCKVRSTPGSGGWATKGGWGPRGDLIFKDKKAPYHVECKKQEGWELGDLLTGKRSGAHNCLERWWNQATNDCRPKKMPMVVFSKNRHPDMLMMRAGDLAALMSANGASNHRNMLGDLQIRGFFVFLPDLAHYDDGKPDGTADEEELLVVIKLDDFFDRVRPPKRSRKHDSWVDWRLR